MESIKTLQYRRIVPAGYVSAKLTLNGTSPILMNSGEVDVEGDLYRTFKMLSTQRKKSDDDTAWMR